MIEFAPEPVTAARDWRAEYHALVQKLVACARRDTLARMECEDMTEVRVRERVTAHQQAQVEAVLVGLRDLLDERRAK